MAGRSLPWLWDTATGKEIEPRLTHHGMYHRDSVYCLVVIPDGQRLGAVTDGGVRFWELATPAELTRLRLPIQGVRVVAISPDGTRIASGGHDRNILIWDVASGHELVRLPGHTSYVFALAFNPDGQTLISGSGDTTVRLWDSFPVTRRLQSRQAADTLPELPQQ
jgi:WD40 repeat protein